MEVKKDIGKAIREKLDTLDRMPGDALWDAINKDLDKNKKKKFPFFWFYIATCTIIGIAVATFILSNLAGADHNTMGTMPDSTQNTTSIAIENPSGNNNNNNNNNNNPEISGSENQGSLIEPVSEKVKPNNKKNNGAYEVNNPVKTENKQKTIGATTSKTNATSNSNKNKKQLTKDGGNATTSGVVKNQANAKDDSGYTYTNRSKKTVNTTEKNNLPDDPENDIADKNKFNDIKTSAVHSVADETSASRTEIICSPIDTKKIGQLLTEDITDTTKVVDSVKTETPKEKVTAEEKAKNKQDSLSPGIFKKLSVFTFAGPSYFSFSNSAVVTDSTISTISIKPATRIGVLFGYRLSNKLTIRTGISSYKLKQSANNIKLNYVMGGDAINPGLIPTPDFTWINYQYPFGTNNSLIINTLGENYQAVVNIDRELSYMEIPLEISYNLIDKRFGLNIFGGGSMLVLNKNKVFAYNEKGKMFLGEWNAAEKTSFTGTLGLGIYYKITPSFQLNAEPVFNYYFNSYKDSNPFSFTFRAGLQYNFDF